LRKNLLILLLEVFDGSSVKVFSLNKRANRNILISQNIQPLKARKITQEKLCFLLPAFEKMITRSFSFFSIQKSVIKMG